MHHDGARALGKSLFVWSTVDQRRSRRAKDHALRESESLMAEGSRESPGDIPWHLSDRRRSLL